MLRAMSNASNASRPPRLADEHVGFNGRLAAALTKAVGTMWVIYFTTTFVLVWMALATWGPLHRLDPYPFAFLLLIGQQVLGRAADRRSARTFQDAESILKQVAELHAHLVDQDKILTRGIGVVEPGEHHPW